MVKGLLASGEMQKASVNQVGGKAYYLSKMIQAGMPVPPFIVLSSEFVDSLLEPIRVDIEQALSGKISKNNLLNISKTIEQLVLSVSFSKELETVIVKACSQRFGENYSLSVRSSSPDEDGQATSFAGLHESFLFVQKDDLLSQILKCIASAWSLSSLAYRQVHSLAFTNIRYAVVLQEMVFAKQSGVGFSMDVQGNMANMILVAGYGIGEGIVEDLVETDTFWVGRLDKRIFSQINNKKYQMKYFPGKGLIKTSIDSELQGPAVLSKYEIIKIVDVLQQAEELLGVPADIEFAFRENGKLVILQMRPVTGIDLNDVKILDNTNIVESYPDVSLPLTFSFVNEAYAMVFANTVKAFWVSTDISVQLESVFQNLLGFYYGRIYYRLDNWYRMMSHVFPSEKSMASWEKAVGLKKDSMDAQYISFGAKIKIYTSMVWLLLNYRRGNRRFFKQYEKDFLFLKSYPKKDALAQELLDYLQLASKRLYRNWYLTLINDLISFKSFGWLQGMIRKYKMGTEELANDLLSGQINSDSEQAILALLTLKQEIVNSSSLMRLFELPNADIMEKLEEKEFAKFVIKMEDYLQDFGDRRLSELKLEVPSFRYDRYDFLDLLKSQLAVSTDIRTYKKKQELIYQQAQSIVNEQFKWWQLKKYKFIYTWRLAVYGLRNRENMRFARTRTYGIAKDIYRLVGKEMEEQGSIEEQNDIFYLTTDEVANYAAGKIGLDAKNLIHRRKQKFDSYSSLDVPDRIMYAGEQVPVLRRTELLEDESIDVMRGISVSKGIVIAEAILVKSPDYSLDVKDKILVSKTTDPGWVFLMSQAVGLISEKGSLLSHTAIVGRELGIPVVVGVDGVSTTIRTGDRVELNGDTGEIRILKDE